MKYIFSLVFVITLFSFTYLDDIYTLPVKTIDGDKINLSQYKGKKILFIILPLSGNDTTVSIKQIAQLQSKYESSLVVIGIPSEETGFKKGEDETKLKNLCKNEKSNFIIAEGLKVKKGEQQSALFEWLTSKERNRHFDQDVRGIGTKFFVDEGGELYAVMGPELKLSNPIIEKILSRQPGKK